MTFSEPFTWATYPWGRLAWSALIFVLVPSAVWSGVIWVLSRAERRDPHAPASTGLAAPVVALVALVLGFLCCAGWLLWSGDSDGSWVGPSLPPPTKFPSWQIAGCGLTTVAACWLCARLARRPLAGGLAAALGTASGFALAFTSATVDDSTGLSGVGIMMCEFGIGLGLTALMTLRWVVLAVVRTRRDASGAPGEQPMIPGRPGSTAQTPTR